VNRDPSVFCVFCVFLIFFLVLNYKCQKSRHFVISNANLIKLHKIIIQDLLNPLTKNHVDRTIWSRVIPNLGVHTFADRQVKMPEKSKKGPKNLCISVYFLAILVIFDCVWICVLCWACKAILCIQIGISTQHANTAKEEMPYNDEWIACDWVNKLLNWNLSNQYIYSVITR